jgi:hypothetical protein
MARSSEPQATTPPKDPGKTARTITRSKTLSASDLPWARHIVCFWKQNDLGIFGRRPDRWIEFWRHHPGVEKVLVFEPPLSTRKLQEMLRLATTLEGVCASEFQLLLEQATRKLLGKCDDAKVKYRTQLPPENETNTGSQYLAWVLSQTHAAGIIDPLVVLWPACFANEALVQMLKPSDIVVDLVDDQRLFPGNESQRQAITDQYQTFIRLGHRIFSNSLGLIDSLSKEFGKAIEHLPNAFLPMLPYSSPTEKGSAEASFQAKDPTRPLVGYVGNMRGRIDKDILIEVIRQHPDWDFWFVGQTHLSEFYQQAKTFQNVRFWGVLRYDLANALLVQFDAAIIPFVADELVKSMSPIKVDDYARLKIPSVVLDSKNKKSFEQALLKALKRNQRSRLSS